MQNSLPGNSSQRNWPQAGRHAFALKIACAVSLLGVAVLLVRLAVEVHGLLADNNWYADLAWSFGRAVVGALVLGVMFLPRVTSAAVSCDAQALEELKRERLLKTADRHHRRWWDLNLVVLFFALLSLAYVRHFAGLDSDLTRWCVVYLFLGWIGLRQVVQAKQEFSDRRCLNRSAKSSDSYGDHRNV